MIMKYRHFNLSIFIVILLMFRQVNVVLCNSQFTLSENGVIKSQIDLECFGNHSGVIISDIYNYIFSPGNGISKLGMLHFPNNYHNEISGKDFISLEFFNKDIGFTCLPFKEGISSTVNNDHKPFAKRKKRNSNSSMDSYYFKDRIKLRCFDVQPSNQIESFKWDFSDGKSLSFQDYYDEPGKFELGDKTGDFVLKNYTGKDVNVSCKPMIAGKQSSDGKSYQLIRIVEPKPPFIEVNGTRLSTSFDGIVGCYIFTCKSLDGRPDPELSLSLNGLPLVSPQNNSIVNRTICIDDTYDGASLICKSTHVGKGEPWKKEETIKINIASGVSGGIIAAIVISLLVLVTVVAGVIAYILRKKHALNKAREYATGEAELG